MLPPSLENNPVVAGKVRVQVLSVTLFGISNGNDVIACAFKIYRKPYRAIYSLELTNHTTMEKILQIFCLKEHFVC
jgi:hypothetical protein